MCPVRAELPEFLQRQDDGTTETLSEAPGADGMHSRSHATRIAAYETTSALVTLPSNEMRNDPADLELIWGSSGGPVCFPQVLPLPAVLLPGQGPPRHGRAGTQLASGSMQVCISPSEPPHTDILQGQGGRGTGPASCAVMIHPDLVFGTSGPRDSPSWHIPLSKDLLSQRLGTIGTRIQIMGRGRPK